MFLQSEDEFYTSTMRDWVAVPEPQAHTIRAFTDDGELIATAFLDGRSGRFTASPDITPATLLYRDWQECLFDQVTDPTDNAELQTAIERGLTF